MAYPEDDGARRPHAGESREMPAARDDELAVIFREMRRASERAAGELAAHLKTAPATLEALEAGNISALPDWSETSRVVEEYTALLNLDSRPVLRRLEARFAARPAVAAPAPKPAAGPAAPPPPEPVAGPPLPPGAAPPATAKAPPAPASRPAAAAAPESPSAPSPARPAAAGAASPAKPRRDRAGAIVTLLLLIAVFGAMALGVRHAIEHPGAVWSTVDSLPDPAPELVRSFWELVRPLEETPQSAPAADPQSLKADRLPGAEAPQDN